MYAKINATALWDIYLDLYSALNNPADLPPQEKLHHDSAFWIMDLTCRLQSGTVLAALLFPLNIRDFEFIAGSFTSFPTTSLLLDAS